MSVESIIFAGRRAAEGLMRSTCVIARVSDGAWDDDILDYSDVVATIYEGRCRLKSGGNQTLSQDAQGQLLAVQQLMLSLPLDGTGDVRADDRVTISDGGPDAALTGQVFRVVGPFAQTWATARRVPVELVT